MNAERNRYRIEKHKRLSELNNRKLNEELNGNMDYRSNLIAQSKSCEILGDQYHIATKDFFPQKACRVHFTYRHNIHTEQKDCIA